MGSQTNASEIRPMMQGLTRFHSLAPLLLVLVLAAAILTDGVLPEHMTKTLLAIGLPLDIAAALWLTRPRD